MFNMCLKKELTVSALNAVHIWTNFMLPLRKIQPEKAIFFLLYNIHMIITLMVMVDSFFIF